MNMIKLTQDAIGITWINLDNVKYISPNGRGTLIAFIDSSSIVVIESIDIVSAKFNAIDTATETPQNA